MEMIIVARNGSLPYMFFIGILILCINVCILYFLLPFLSTSDCVCGDSSASDPRIKERAVQPYVDPWGK